MMDIVVGFFDRNNDPEFKDRPYQSSGSSSSKANTYSPWVNKQNQSKPNVMHAPAVSNQFKVKVPVPGRPSQATTKVVNVTQDSLPIAMGN